MDRNINQKIGKKLRVLREAHNYTQRFIGDKLGLSDAAVSLIESGRNKLNPEHAQKLAKLYEITVDDIYRDDDAIKQDAEHQFRKYTAFFAFLNELGIRTEGTVEKHIIQDQDGKPYETGAFDLEYRTIIEFKKRRYNISGEQLDTIKGIIEENTINTIRNSLQLITVSGVKKEAEHGERN